MTNESEVNNHYTHGTLLEEITSGIEKLGKNIDNITVEDLGSVDEFHIGGRIATRDFLNQLKFSENYHVLDIGCGLGGAARYVAQTFGSAVTGIDLTEEYIRTGNILSEWVNLNNKVTLNYGNALALPYGNEAFDGGYMMHVAMNVEDKSKLFSEIYRV